MVSHNNVVPNAHFRKHWQTRVRTWLNQAGRKKSRRTARLKKALAIAPRPVEGSLRPIVRCPTFKYNTKVRAGRGFTLDELAEAKISRKEAKSFGICVDHRRKSRSEEGLRANVQRLKEYKSNLIVFPRRAGAKQLRKGDAPADVRKTAVQLKGAIMPVTQAKQGEKARAITADEKDVKKSVFREMRITRADARLVGIREKRRKALEEEAAMKKTK